MSDLGPNTYPAAAIGYRRWGINRQGYLTSTGMRGVWRPGVNIAYCPRGHMAPENKCQCGLYLLHDVEGAVEGTSWGGKIVGAVAARGAVSIHHDGFRAEEAQIVGLLDPELRDSSREVAERYRVPLFDDPARLRAHAEKLGSPVPAAERDQLPKRPRERILGRSSGNGWRVFQNLLWRPALALFILLVASAVVSMLAAGDESAESLAHDIFYFITGYVWIVYGSWVLILLPFALARLMVTRFHPWLTKKLAPRASIPLIVTNFVLMLTVCVFVPFLLVLKLATSPLEGKSNLLDEQGLVKSTAVPDPALPQLAPVAAEAPPEAHSIDGALYREADVGDEGFLTSEAYGDQVPMSSRLATQMFVADDGAERVISPYLEWRGGAGNRIQELAGFSVFDQVLDKRWALDAAAIEGTEQLIVPPSYVRSLLSGALVENGFLGLPTSGTNGRPEGETTLALQEGRLVWVTALVGVDEETVKAFSFTDAKSMKTRLWPPEKDSLLGPDEVSERIALVAKADPESVKAQVTIGSGGRVLYLVSVLGPDERVERSELVSARSGKTVFAVDHKGGPQSWEELEKYLEGI